MAAVLKICNIKNIYEARSVGELGVSMAGLHLISKNDFRERSTLKRIIKLFHQEFPQTRSILVTKERDIQTIIRLISDLECDGVQLHYEADASHFALLRSYFGDHFLLLGVAAPDGVYNAQTFEQTDYVIVDKSYMGGTGTQLAESERRRIVKLLKGRKLLLAGGIDASYLRQHATDSEVAGYDIQSAVRANKTTAYENISYPKLLEVAKYVQYHPPQAQYRAVGYSPAAGENLTALFNLCDFWHFDFYDGVFGMNTDVPRLVRQLVEHGDRNSHMTFQIHIFSALREYVLDIIEQLAHLSVKQIEFYVHASREIPVDDIYDNNVCVYPSLDVRDVIFDQFPLEVLRGSHKVLLCLQSEKHVQRGTNAAVAQRMIDEIWLRPPEITLDRGLGPCEVQFLDKTRCNIVSGSYLRQHGKDGYDDLKRSLWSV